MLSRDDASDAANYLATDSIVAIIPPGETVYLTIGVKAADLLPPPSSATATLLVVRLNDHKGVYPLPAG
ncbi:MAG: hypothetical protein LBF05_05040, partial [Tannerella sp.]|nr:hypothetical protein [Tannerella sp.]